MCTHVQQATNYIILGCSTFSEFLNLYASPHKELYNYDIHVQQNMFGLLTCNMNYVLIYLYIYIAHLFSFHVHILTLSFK